MLNLSTGSQDSHISHISSILPKHFINSVINEEDDPLIKNLINEEFRNLEHAEKEKEKHELEIKREEAKEKASALWKKLKAIEEQKAAEEKLKQQRMREEAEAQQKHEEDKIKAAKEYEMKLKQQLKEKYMKDVEKEKQRIEMQKIEQKYGPEILSQVRKDMGLPMLPVPNLMPSPSQIPGTSFPPSTLPSPQGIPHLGITPSSLLAKVKQEKYQRTELADPDNQYKPSPSPSSGVEKMPV